ncbi:Tetratricopeptide repeat protein [Sphingomonas antarctica]|uniref:tetratricopeptide repeat protein n=1 Tax=Sphingomonas antarctica TaxID=2040274 RepID=UPI0039EB4715
MTDEGRAIRAARPILSNLGGGLALPPTAASIESRLWKLAIAILVAGLVVLALTRLLHPATTSDRAPPIDTLPLSYGPKNYAAAVVLADNAVALGTERVRARPQDWIFQESYARALMGRARLTLSFDDLQQATLALAKGKAEAIAGSGPLLTDAVANFTVHRMAPIAQDLRIFDAAAVRPDKGDRAEAEALRGDVAFYSGQYGQAAAHYRASAAIDDGMGLAFRIANFEYKTGHPDAARAQFERSARMNTARTRQFMANVWLQSGVVELSRGRWDDAEALFRKADQTFPGYWLIEAHVAQMAALRGKLDEAAQAYHTIIARTGQPDVIDALAVLYRVAGNGPASRAWAARSAPVWDRRLGMLPEAAYAHALEHELVLGDPARALSLARANMAARPYGDSVTMLAWALIANGKADEAARLVEALNKTQWRTAQQYGALSQAYAMLGDSTRSDAARDTALDINPRAFDPNAALIWFGNH